METFVTACPRNCYSTCSMKVYVEEGRLVKIEPEPGNRAAPEGPCLKGLSYVERTYSKDRILKPRLKNDRGEWDDISWDEAFKMLIRKLNDFKMNSDPRSIFYYQGSGTKGLTNSVGLEFWKLFGGCTTTFGDLCWPAGLEAARLTLGENKHNAPWDIENSKLIIMWGKNSAETNIHQMLFVNRAIDNGAKLVVIDPRRTETSERAHLLLQPAPGTDAALALAAANYIIENDLHDEEFIKNYVHGFDEYKTEINKYTIKYASEVTGIPADLVTQFAELIGNIKPAVINAGYGMQRFSNGGQTIRSLISLCAITGNIGKPGAGWNYANLQSDIFSKLKEPESYYPREIEVENIRAAVSTARLGRDLLKLTNPPLKMIWVERGNPVTQNPETNSVIEAFRKAEFVVVIDQFMTDSALMADLVLPAKSMFEQTDVIGAYWHPYIQYKPKVIDLPGEVKPEYEIYHELTRRLGMPVSEVERRIPEPGEENLEKYLEKKLEGTGLTLEKLKEGPQTAPGHQETAFSDFKFKTRSGKIELLSEKAELLWNVNKLPDFKLPAETLVNSKNQRYSIHLLTPNTKDGIHSQFINLKSISGEKVETFLYMHPDDAAARDIKINDIVRIYNDRGEIKMHVRLDFSIRPGCAFTYNGYWFTHGAGSNRLSAARETDMGHGAAFHDNLIEIEKV